MIAFLGGLQQKQNPYLPLEMGFRELSGFHFDEAGSLVKWGGFSREVLGNLMPQITSSGNPEVVSGIYNFVRASGAAQLLVVTDKALYLQQGTLWQQLVGALPLVPGLPYDFLKQNDLCYIVGGANNLKWDGLSVNLSGVAASSTAPGAALSGAGVLTGNYFYAFSFVAASGLEGNLSPPSNVVATASNSVALGVLVSPDPQVVARRIYRTTTGGAVLLFVGEIPDNTTLLFNDNFADGTLGVAGEEFSFGVPPVSNLIEGYAGFAFYAVTGSIDLSFSEHGQPEHFDENDVLTLTSSDVEQVSTITGMKQLYDRLVVFKRDSIWNVTGTDRFNLRADIQVQGVGATSNAGIQRIPGKAILVFPSENGFYSYNGTSEEYISRDIEGVWRGLNQSLLSEIEGVVYEKSNCVKWIAAKAGSTEKNLEIIYFYAEGQWATRDLPIGISTIAALEDFESVEFFVAGGYDGFVRTGDIGGSDDGTVLSTRIAPLAMPKGMFTQTIKCFNEVSLFFQPLPGGIVSVSLALDTPDATYLPVGQIDLSVPSGFQRITFNRQGIRAYLRFDHAQNNMPVVLRGYDVGFFDTGRKV